jgi:small subunit ribosomal protein S1
MIGVGDELTLTVLRFDAEKGRVSLGLKQLAGDPWSEIGQSFSVGSKVRGKVTNIADYGCFVELKNGVEGLIHVSEMDWTNKNVNPHKIVQLGSEIEVMILEIDMDRRRISLGLKQCVSNPWERFAKEHAKGDVVKGKIKSITDFGIFLGLAGDIDGLIHLSDLSWTVPGEVAVRDFKKGDEIEAVVLSADADRERISLGIKQMEGDRAAAGAGDAYQKGNIVKGSILSIDEKKGLEVDLGEGMVGHIRRAELSRDRVEDLASAFKVGSEVEAIVTGVDKKSNIVNLSIKAMTEAEEKEALRSINKSEEKVTTTLGDLIKEKMGKIEE